VRRALVLFAFLAGTAAAQPNGVLLVAKPDLPDPNFEHTVVLVTRADDGSTVGVILNRPLEKKERLYEGGPVMRQAIVALFAADEPPAEAAFRVLPNVYLSLHPALIDRLRASPPAHARFFAGFAGWAPQQLEAEVDAGGWYVLRASEALVFRADRANLWDELVERARGGRADSKPIYWTHAEHAAPAFRATARRP